MTHLTKEWATQFAAKLLRKLVLHFYQTDFLQVR